MNNRPYFVLAGPIFFFLSFVLLLYKAGFLLARPVWLCGMGFSVALACFISYLVYKELVSQESRLVAESLKKMEEAKSIRSVLDEAQQLYREKVEKLEKAFTEMEKESQELMEEKEGALDALKYEYEVLNVQAYQASNHADHFHVSLEDALDELRQLRQIHYLIEEHEKEVPRDIINKHKQLREQFEEKSMILDQTRRRLFVIEGHLHALKHQSAMEKLDRHAEEENVIEMLGKMIDENGRLEKEIQLLEIIVSNNLNPPKFKKSKRQLQEILEFQFEKTTI